MSRQSIIALAFAMLTVFGIGICFVREREQLYRQGMSFVAALSRSEQEARGFLITPELGDTREFHSLYVLARNPSPTLAPRVRLHPWPWRREVWLELSGLTQRKSLSIRFSSAHGQLKVSSLPPLLAHPAALLREDRSMSIYGQEVAPQGAQDHSPGVGMGVVIDNRLLYFQPLTPRVEGRLLRLVPRTILETDRLRATLEQFTAIYGLMNGRLHARASILPGARSIGVIEWNNRIYGLLETEPFVPEAVRVVLNVSNYRGLLHEAVTISSAEGLTLTNKVEGHFVRVQPSADITLSQQGAVVVATDGARELLRGSRLHVQPLSESGIEIKTIQRALGTPTYRGVLEVAPAVSGRGLVLVNELSLDQYLYSVVPSEMPVGFGLEALKVQAVAARSYAVASIMGGGYGTYGAHVEDSVMSQVYNNVREHPVARAAVDATAGQIGVFQGKVMDARFFSTSAGVTANFEEVWSVGADFPGVGVPYLRSIPQVPSIGALNNEDLARAFIERHDWPAPDRASPFFRWSVSLTRAELEEIIVRNLPERQRTQSAFVKTLTGPKGNTLLGELTDIRVVQRGAGGNAMALEVVGTEASYRIAKELNIRMLLRPVQYLDNRGPVRLVRQDGSVLNNYQLLPSAFIYFDIQVADERIHSVTIHGGGNGHGVGMSQFGARGLTERGLSYREVIYHYYPGTELKTLREVFAP